MKVAILGDIHGNSLALEAVLNSAKEQDVKLLLITGDLVGYYFAPDKVLELLESWNKHMVRGNHEDMLAAVRGTPAKLAGIEKKYGSGLRIALESLSDAQLDTLCDLPHPVELELEGRKALLCHGAPWDNDTYVYPDADNALLARCVHPGVDMVILGHTHYPMMREIGGTLVVNPGSVGQPRNRQPGAHWALYDTATHTVSLRCEPYDPRPLVEESRRRHPEILFLANVLERT